MEGCTVAIIQQPRTPIRRVCPAESSSEIHESDEIYLTESAVKPENLRYISVRGAREHNLKNVDAEIPHRKLTTFTGVRRFRKVVVGARYHLRRGATPIR